MMSHLRDKFKLVELQIVLIEFNNFVLVMTVMSYDLCTLFISLDLVTRQYWIIIIIIENSK